MLFKFVIAFIVVCVVFANARMVHMEQSIANEDFIRMEQADGNQIHEVIFSVKQRNIAALDQFLMEVSTPGSPKYGKYLTRAEVAAITANPTATSAIEAYLKKNGAEVVKKTPYGEYITAKAPISVWEKLFATTFYNFKHAENKVKPVPRAVHYSIDNELSDHVEAVFQTTQLPNIAPPKLPLRSSESVGVGGKITPAVLNSYYHITSNTGNTLGSQAVFESIGQYYSPSDLLTFEAQYGIPLYNVTTDIGGYEADAPCVEDPNNCAEANLDVQYLMAISQVTPTTYWYDGATDSFLDWIRAVASSENPPLVNSISYGATETALPKSIANAFNNEALKLGTMGVTVLVSSGDDGVAGNGARKNPSKCGYSPSFPATSQYVTAVGATQGAESGAAQETACLSNTGGVITTGGGFSTVFSAPTWQKDAIANYFKVATTPKSGYSTSGRGYPDVSLAGLNYEVVVGGKTYAVSGTSASAPSVAAMVALVNANRLAAGKSALGFLNPSIYAFGSKFSNDVVTGENNCTAGQVCCSEGFYSAAGWDPVTGFGSVDFAKFNAIFAAL